MIAIENYLGRIMITEDFLISLISHTASQCFGVVRLNAADNKGYGLLSVFSKKKKWGLDRSVKLESSPEGLIVGLHITVMFGTKISAVTDSLVHKIRYTVEEKTGLKISRMTVYIDGISN